MNELITREMQKKMISIKQLAESLKCSEETIVWILSNETHILDKYDDWIPSSFEVRESIALYKALASGFSSLYADTKDRIKEILAEF